MNEDAEKHQYGKTEWKLRCRAAKYLQKHPEILKECNSWSDILLAEDYVIKSVFGKEVKSRGI